MNGLTEHIDVQWEHPLMVRFLERLASFSRLIMFDRRGAGASELEGDYRMHRIQQALDILLDPSGGRAERIQKLFSDDYDPSWEKPLPK